MEEQLEFFRIEQRIYFKTNYINFVINNKHHNKYLRQYLSILPIFSSRVYFKHETLTQAFLSFWEIIKTELLTAISLTVSKEEHSSFQEHRV